MNEYDHSNSDDEGFYNEAKSQEEHQVKEEVDKIPTKKSFYKKKVKRIRKKEKTLKKTHNQKQNRLLQMGDIHASKIIEEMQKRFEQDLKLYRNKKAAVKKLTYIETLSRQLKNIYVCQKFLQYNGLTLFEKWLGKLPDGFEPNLTLRKSLFEILLFLKIRGEHIARAQELQKIIHKHKRSQTKQLRELSEAIMIKWGQITYQEINQ